MSRIGKKIIILNEGTKVDLEASNITLVGPMGSLSCILEKGISVKQEANSLRITMSDSIANLDAKHGLYRALIANMVKGVQVGFSQDLEIVGVGFKVQYQSPNLLFTLGFSHTILVEPPVGISFAVEGQNKIKVVGIDNQLVGQVSANIRSLRPPDAYKGKGIRYAGEVVRKKQGKSVKK